MPLVSSSSYASSAQSSLGAPTLLILGAGPVGSATAWRAAQTGWHVEIWDPGCTSHEEGYELPEWPGHYGIFLDQAPSWLINNADYWRMRHSHIEVYTQEKQEIPLPYGMLNNSFIRRQWSEDLRNRGAVFHPSACSPQELVDLYPQADLIIDTRPVSLNSSISSPTQDTNSPTQHTKLPKRVFFQIAMGWVLPSVAFSDFSDGSEELREGLERKGNSDSMSSILMDWREAPRISSSSYNKIPSFLYAQPLSEEYILYEETILITPIGLSQRKEKRQEYKRILQERLSARLNIPVDSPQILAEEWVEFPMNTLRSPWWKPRYIAGIPVVSLGAAGGNMHPATGYCLGDSFTTIDTVLGLDPHDDLGYKNHSYTSSLKNLTPRVNRFFLLGKQWSSECAYRLRYLGGALLAEASYNTLSEFFSFFFAMTIDKQKKYLFSHQGRDTASAMWELRNTAGWRHPFLTPLWKKPWKMIYHQ